MARITRSIFPPAKPRTVFLAADLPPLLEFWRRLRQRIFHSYRPELHYMRGPGPRCLEKRLMTSVWSISRQR